ncbi:MULTISPECIES: glutathione transferase GstA [Pseudomonas]|uniref:glutathione transferase GstA n=1 Tax=Pseudomonas TaxID=286 RepID=UPI001E4B5015|nr:MULTISPECIES: glutathione transferase GstA [Pseudomonas]MCE4069243.1 glutathione transferase GstA [Pseudomonas nitritireducens]MCE4079593.1 glutathione transferase GstA [Pseudomonas nitroreducens]
MKLYFAPNACSLAAHIVLRELGLPFSLVRVDNRTKRTADGQDFYRINPKGYVAALQLEDGTVLTEGAAILQYLADLKLEAGLAPANGTLERTHLQAQLNFIGSELHAGMSPLFDSEIPEPVKDLLRSKLARRLGYLEQVLAANGQVAGDSFSIADAYLFTVLGWSEQLKVDLGAYPAIRHFHQAVGMRPAVIEALRAEAEVPAVA